MTTEAKNFEKGVGQILDQHKHNKEMLVAILQDAQKEFNYLPREVLTCVAEGLALPVSHVYSVATYYKAFSLKPRGRHSVNVCMGTACHVRGAVKVLDRLKQVLGIEPGETTEDFNFTLETVNCVGACALGPVVVVDGEYVGQVTQDKVEPMLESCD